jgi:hypothetical protein
MNTKECMGCDVIKPVTEFFKRSNGTDGYQSYCKPCSYNRRKLNKNNSPAKKKKKSKSFKKKPSDNAMYLKKMIRAAIKRAKKAKLPFNIDKLDPSMLTIPKTCPILGIPLFKATGRQSDNSPSLDRIYSDRGYMIDNIHIISWKANRLKNNGNIQELRKIVDYFEAIDAKLNSKTNPSTI